MLSNPDAGVIIVTSEAAKRRKVEALEGMRGVRVIVAGRGPLVDFAEAFRRLSEMGIRRVLVEGGGTLIGLLMKAGYVDELRVTFSPYVFGEGCVKLVRSVGFKDTESSPKLRLRNVIVCKCGHEVHVEYEVVEPRVPLL
jgi:2,5-diamino-6-(ribosylamino)-4(3H)-pyrimidinone 5'-phosphate reductase